MPAKHHGIGDYGIIGDCATAALVSNEGSIDWLCLPTFDAHSVFAALLDPQRGGHWSVRPHGSFVSRRAYVGHTAVLRTEFETADGLLRVTDFMPAAKAETYHAELRSDHELLRKIEVLRGSVDVEIEIEPRPDYADKIPRLESRGRLGVFCHDRPHVFVFRSDIDLHVTAPGCIRGRAMLDAGDVRWVAMAQDTAEPAILPVLGDLAETRLQQTLDYWRQWIAMSRYEGPYRDIVLRSAMTLKLLTFAQSGAIVAAATTSLPELRGGGLNWDYRYCWPRDASWSLQALLDLGYVQEAEAFMSWLLHTGSRSLPELGVLYDLHGRRVHEERTIPWLRGYASSAPVRVGNAAADQRQLDICGEVIHAIWRYCQHGGVLGRWHRRMLFRLGRAVLRDWGQPDHGLWEHRAEPRRHTFSAVMCVAALEGLLQIDRHQPLGIPRERYMQAITKMRREIEARAYNHRLGSYVAAFDSDDLDASTLLLPTYGYIDPRHPRMTSTYECLRRELARGPLWYRYSPKSRERGESEGAFGLCGFWSVEYLTRIGRIDEARRDFEALLGYGNDLGLFAEEIDPQSGAPLGNFPQAFTHLGLINAALSLSEPYGSRTVPHPVDVERDRHEQFDGADAREQEVGT